MLNLLLTLGYRPRTQGLNVLSLFDGMSCGQLALERAGIPVARYYASEVDKYAMKVAKANYPNTIHLGCVKEVQASRLPNIDILIGGSPCQGFSFAGKQLNFEDERSKLFFEYVRLLRECKPKYFLLENVKMKKEYQDIISKYMGVEPIEINSSLVSAQNRKWLYWTNIPGIEQPEDRGILIKDITEDSANQIVASRGRYIVDGKRQDHKGSVAGKATQRLEPRHDGKSNTLTTVQKDNYLAKIVKLDSHSSKDGLVCLAGVDKNKKWLDDGKILQRNFSQGERIYSTTGKSPTLSACSGGTAGLGSSLVSEDEALTYRKLTPLECERLQTVPDGYTAHVSNTQRYRMLGNGWTVDVIAHIFKNIELGAPNA